MTLVRSFEDSAKLAGARVDALTNQLDQIKQQATTAGGQDVELRALEREARAQRDLLESFLGRYRDAASRSDPASVQPDARIISMASAAIEPTYPKKLPIILMAALAMMLLAAALSAIGVLMAAAPSEDDEPDAPSPVPGPAQGDGPHHLPWIGSPGADVPEAGAARAEAKAETRLADLSRLVELRGEGARLVIVTGPAPDDGRRALRPGARPLALRSGAPCRAGLPRTCRPRRSTRSASTNGRPASPTCCSRWQASPRRSIATAPRAAI